MIQINSIPLTRLRKNEHFQFMTDVHNMIHAVTPGLLGLEALFPDFTTAWHDLNTTLMATRGSMKTREIAALDLLIKRTWSAIGGRLRYTLMSPVEAEVESARVLRHIYRLYGRIRDMSFIERTAAISNLIEDFEKPENAAHCNTVGITNWVALLKQQKTDFQGLFDARNTELANKENKTIKAMRAVIDPKYAAIVDHINAMVILEMATPEIENFVVELNQRIKYYNDGLSVREGRKSRE